MLPTRRLVANVARSYSIFFRILWGYPATEFDL